MNSDRFDKQDDGNVRALWQSDVSQIARMSADDLQKRVEYLRYQFDGTRWIPWAASVFLAAFFGVMLFAVASNAANVVGGVIGLIGAFVPAGCMVMLNRRGRPGATTACVHAYEAQLARERSAVNASAITILAMMIGAGLLSVPSEGGLRAALLSMAGPSLTGIATAWYLRRQTRQYDRRIQELRRISA
jgi:hypothetical protein